jgi:hypothetical protein
LDPGVEVEVDSRDPASWNSYDAWRQSCADAAPGRLNRIDTGP